jgi:crossover junction endodeoxyribonuclease RuvC
MPITRILGIDPGLNRTGWGVIESEDNRLRHVAHGVITSDPADALSTRLSALYSELAKVIVTWQPEEAAVEEVFVNKNPASTLKLGMARGVALLAPAMAGLSVGEYAANLVKKSVVGSGHADKSQVAMMVGILLPGTKAKADAADALAVAICHAHHRSAPKLPRALAIADTSRERPQPPSPGSFAADLSPEGRGQEPSSPRSRVALDAYPSKPSATHAGHARRLRVDSTDVEAKLWQALRNNQLGIKFRRQSPILGFVADFLSNDAKLIVELDGGQHADSLSDQRRTKMFEQAGFRVLRFWNNEVNENFDGVMAMIAGALPSLPRPSGERSERVSAPGEGGSLRSLASADMGRGDLP